MISTPWAMVGVVALASAVVGGAAAVLARARSALRARAAAARAEQLEHALREAERLADVGRVAATVAHEIGNPLTGIANYAHVLRARVSGSPEALAALDGIEHEVARIDRITSSLLGYAKPKLDTPSHFDAGTALRSAVQLLAAQGVFRRVQVHSSIDEAPLEIVGNAHELEQAFVNLLLNAIDAMEAHGTIALYAGRTEPDTALRAPRRSVDAPVQSFERRVDPRLEEWRSHVPGNTPCAKFVVADSGGGIDRTSSDRIFEPFYTTKAAGEGSGLGLAIVQRAIEAHNGVVWVQRAREGGAAFHVLLPLQALHAPHEHLS